MSLGESWGRFPRVSQQILDIAWRDEALGALNRPGSLLAYGQGRSYGDSCLNDGGTLLSTRFLNKIISFDPASGILRAESGLTIDDLLAVIVPAGWFVPVTPGTRFVSLGGALANDVHGKNHHTSGTFGRHISRFGLLRSDGGVLECSPDSEGELFKATIGGLGLTGLILWAELRLKKISSALIDVEKIKFRGLEEFFDISQNSERSFEYTVAWLDCVSSGADFARGIFMRGNHAINDESSLRARETGFKLAVPMDFPAFALNNWSIKAFNAVYYGAQRAKKVSLRQRYEPFFHPLDSVLNWNRIYGKNGLFQFQCVVPRSEGRGPITEILNRIVSSGKGSFLAVLKEFSSIESPGLLSFPRDGVTLCLDFKNEGESTTKLLKELDQMVAGFGGAIYPAKDAVMSPVNFRKYFPSLERFKLSVDPKFSSSFWRRTAEVA